MICAPIFKPPRKVVIKIKVRVLADTNPDQTIKYKTETSKEFCEKLGVLGQKNTNCACYPLKCDHKGRLRPSVIVFN